jgi:polar amino acid transport system substrate-binding protein
MACWAGYYPWSRTAIDLGAPVIVVAACLVLANRLRHLGRQHFVRRLADLKISPAGSTLFLRAFRDDQVRIRRASRNLFSSVFDLGRMPGTLDELMLERLDGHGDLIAIGNPQDRKGAARQSPWGAQRLYVDDAHWRETVTMLGRDADRIVLCVDASDGVRWEIAHVLRNGHASKTLFFLTPSIDAQTRTRLLMEDFSVCAADLASVDVDRILALRATSPEQLLLMFCARPERDAYLVAARLAFEDTVADAASESAGALAADNERTVLAPKGRLRVGAYPGSPLSMLQEKGTGETHGLSIDLGKELAKRLGVPFEQVNYQRIADVLEGMKAGDVDFTISNATPPRALDVAFSQTLLSLELGYLVPAAAAIATAFDLDKPGIRVGVTQGSTSERTLPKMLAQAAVVPAQNVNDAIRMLARGELDAFATNKPTLFEMSDAMPGARILDGRWGVEHVAVAIPKGRDSAMEYVRRFVEDVQSSGLLAQAMERAGLRGAVEAE